MKKILSGILAASVILFSCRDDNATTATSETQTNLEASRKISKAFETGDTTNLDSVFAADFVDHTDMGDRKGVDSVKSMIRWMHSNFKDMKMETKKEWAEGEYVNTWMRYTGTSPVAMGGMPAGPYDFQAMELARFKDGKAVEHWSFMNMQDMAKMMQGNAGNTNMGQPVQKKDSVSN